ncbi:energy transducer TonB [Roseiarcus sp.]|uniref:energy transducer TonB n=1 Tax=Roseiarcus sp. TaxID=1969460 RepID=UPI003F95DB07
MADDDAPFGDPEKPRDFPDRASEAAAPHRSGAETESGELAGDAPAPLVRPADRPVRLQPRWLRPAIVALVAAAHASTLIALSSIRSPAPPAVATIEATVIAAGDEAPVTTAAAQAPEPGGESAPEAKPSAPTPPAPEPTPPVETPAPAAAEQAPAPRPEPTPPEPPPVVAAEETPPLPPIEKPPPAETQPPQMVAPAETPPPVAKDQAAAPASARLEEPPRALAREFETAPPPPRVQTPPRPKPETRPEPAERPKAARPDAAEHPKPHKTPAPAENGATGGAAAARPGASEAHHVGTATGQPVDSGASRASYAALVVAEIQAHRFYPESARQRSVQGAVGVSFTIGPSGRVAAASVVRSSGSAELDAAARTIVRSISPPPPPGGSFSASTSIRFHVE